MSSTSIADEGYDDLEDDGGLSGFWILSIFLIVLCVFSAIVYFAYQRGLSDRTADGGLPSVVADPSPVRQEIELAAADTTRDEVMDELNGTDNSSRVVADVDPDDDPLANYDEGTTAPLETTGGADPITDPFANVPATTDTTVPDTSSGSNTPPVPNVAPDRPAVAETTPAPTPDVTQSRPIAGAAGSWAVQVGAFGSQDEAMNNYERLSSRIGTLVSGQIADVNVATVNGTTYYRLWLGEFSSRSEANDHCAALKSAGQDCLTRQRS